jgi:hypothetical protein
VHQLSKRGWQKAAQRVQRLRHFSIPRNFRATAALPLLQLRYRCATAASQQLFDSLVAAMRRSRPLPAILTRSTKHPATKKCRTV